MRTETELHDRKKTASFIFPDEYRKLRESLRTAVKSAPDSYVRSVLMPLFRSVMSFFPEDLSHMEGIKNDFMCVFAVAAEEGAEISDLFDISEDFWSFFCCHLRLDPERRENAAQSIWADIPPYESEIYMHGLRNRIHDFYKKHGSDPTADRLSEEWKKNTDEFEKLLSEYPDNTDDTDSVPGGKDL